MDPERARAEHRIEGLDDAQWRPVCASAAVHDWFCVVRR
jgi:hypothetical protein